LEGHQSDFAGFVARDWCPARGTGAVEREDLGAATGFEVDVVEPRVGFELEVSQVGHDDGVSKVRILLSSEDNLGATRWLTVIGRVARVAFDENALEAVDGVNVRTCRQRTELDIVQIVYGLFRGNKPGWGNIHA
jgi:hypothetical protein